MISQELHESFISEIESILSDIKGNVSRSIVLISTKGSSGTAQDALRVAVIPKDRLYIANLLCRLAAGLIQDESKGSVEIPYPVREK